LSKEKRNKQLFCGFLKRKTIVASSCCA